MRTNKHLLIALLFGWAFTPIYSQVMVLSASADGPSSVLFDMEYSTCVVQTPPDGWLNRNATPDCASSRGAVLNPTDADDEVLMFGESLRRDISSLGLIAGRTVTLSMVVGAGNFGGGAIAGDHSFNVRFHTTDPGYSSSWSGAPGCTGGELALSGTNNTLTAQTFTNTIVLTQDANWVVISNCDATGNGGNVIDDLELSW